MLWQLLFISVPIAAATADGDTWIYGEAGKYCMALFRNSPAQLVIRFSATTDDDTIQVWRKGLPSLLKDVSKSDEAAAVARHYDLSLRIGNRLVPLTSRTGNLKPINAPGIAYVLGVDERAFIEGLAANDAFEIRRGSVPVATFQIANHATLASRLAACTAAN